MPVSRRSFLAAAGAAPVAVALDLAVGSRAASAADFGLPYDYPVALPPPFAHGVASGDPLADRVILWTRLTLPDPDRAGTIPVTWEAATDPAMTAVVASGAVVTSAARDWTVKVDAALPSPATTYYYRFRAEGATSATGRTRTAPDSAVDEVRFGVVSCSSYFSAFFNAYARLADRNDLDCVLHCGDHIYESVDEDEWVRSRGPMDETGNVDFRRWRNLEECRRRYALYYADPDKLRLHLSHPMAIVWDNHDITSFGDGDASKPQGVFWEWVPCRPPKGDGSGAFPTPTTANVVPEDVGFDYRALSFGPLADVFLIDRITRRQGDQLLGAQQRSWLLGGMTASKAAGVAWRVVVNGFPLAQLRIVNPVTGVPLLPANPITGGTEFYGAWDEFPAERTRVLSALRSAGVDDNVVVTGDIHGNFASDLVEDERLGAYEPVLGTGSVGVEFTPSSVGRGGADETLAGVAYRQANGGSPPFADRAGFEPFLAGAQPASIALEEALMAANSTLRYVEWRSHGFGIVHLTQERAVLEHWWQPILEPSTQDVLGAQHTVARGSNHITRVPLPAATSGSRVSAPAPVPSVAPPPVVPELGVPALFGVTGFAAVAAALWVAKRRGDLPAG